MRSIYTILVLVALLVSCIGNQPKDNSQITKIVQEHLKDKSISFDEDVRNCVIIPGGGCSGCIASGISFVNSHKENFGKMQKRNIVVFTNIFSLKKLRKQLDVMSFDELNCIVDTSNMYLMHCDENIYPIVLMLDKSKLKDVKVQSPQEEGLYEINL